MKFQGGWFSSENANQVNGGGILLMVRLLHLHLCSISQGLVQPEKFPVSLSILGEMKDEILSFPSLARMQDS